MRNEYNDKAPSSEFCSYLVEKLLIDRETAQAKYEKLAKLYTESVAFCFPPSTPNLSNEAGRRTETPMETHTQNTREEPSPEVPCDIVRYGASDDYSIWVKNDAKAIEFVESQIDAIKAWLKHQKGKLESEKS